MRILMMLTGLVARLLLRADVSPKLGRETDNDRQAAETLATMRDANMTDEASAALVTLGGCYHNGVAYSLAYDANGVVELCGKTFTNLDTGIDGGATAALHRHRQNYDPSRDVEQFIVALRPIKVIKPTISSMCETYGLPPGPLAGEPPVAKVWGERVANGQFKVIERAMEQVKLDCERRGIDISKSIVTVSVTPHDGQEAFARCEPEDKSNHSADTRAARAAASPLQLQWGAMADEAEHHGDFIRAKELNRLANRYKEFDRNQANSKCGECSSPYCECDGTCDPDYATSCHRCDTWVCCYCVVDGACHDCFAKMQGGVC